MTDNVEISCQELVELVTDYLEGVLPPAERRRFDEHVGRCSGCRMYLTQMRQTIELTGRIRTQDLSPDAESALLQAFAGWRGR